VSCARFFCSIWPGRGGSLLVKYCSCCDLRCVDFQLELFAGIWSDEYWGRCDSLLDFLHCIYAFLRPYEWYVFAEESGNRGSDLGESGDEHAMVACDSYEASCSLEVLDFFWPV